MKNVTEDFVNSTGIFKQRQVDALVMQPQKPTKDELFRKKQEEMPDAELAELAREEVSKMCKTGGRSITMCVPPMVTDTDMLLCELIRRFKKLSGVA